MKKHTILFYLFLLSISVNNLKAQTVLDFDGYNDRVQVQPDDLFNINSGTIEAKIKTSDAGVAYSGIVVKKLAYGLFLNNNELGTYDWSTSNWRGTGVFLDDNIWHHIAMTFNSGVENQTIIYLDGLPVLTTTMAIASTNEPLSLGSGSINSLQLFEGKMTAVRVWSVVRTQNEIQSTINSELTGLESGLVVDYQFNQGIAGGNNSEETILLDSGSNNITGSLTGFSLEGSSSNWVQSDSVLSVDDNDINNPYISIYPNPVKNAIKVSGLLTKTKYNIYSVMGTIVSSGSISVSENITLANIAKGVYVLRLDTGDVFKFIKE